MIRYCIEWGVIHLFTTQFKVFIAALILVILFGTLFFAQNILSTRVTNLELRNTLPVVTPAAVIQATPSATPSATVTKAPLRVFLPTKPVVSVTP
jgi:hypothetical protein